MKNGDWVLVNLENLNIVKQKAPGWVDYNEYLYVVDYQTTLPVHLEGRDVAEGRIVDQHVNNSQKGPLIEFPWIAEEEQKRGRIPWDLLEPKSCAEHGNRLYHDEREEWYCPFCDAGGGVTSS